MVLNYDRELGIDNIELSVPDSHFPDGVYREKYSFEYRFDSIGNWIKKTSYRFRDYLRFSDHLPVPDKVPGEATYRTITYYEGVKE